MSCGHAVTRSPRPLLLGMLLQTAEKIGEGAVVLTMLPDTAERYLSTPLFESVGVEMNEEEVAISKSTPGFQMPDAE